LVGHPGLGREPMARHHSIQRPSPQSNLMRLAAMLGAGSWPGTLPTVGEAQSGGPPGGRRVAIVVVSTD